MNHLQNLSKEASKLIYKHNNNKYIVDAINLFVKEATLNINKTKFYIENYELDVIKINSLVNKYRIKFLVHNQDNPDDTLSSFQGNFPLA